MIRFAENLNKMIAAGLGGALEAPRTEVAVGHCIRYLEASGPVASFESNIAAPIRSLRVDMQPIQAGSGDPSPENVRPITGRESVTVTRTSKNLFDSSVLTEQAAWKTVRLSLPPGTYTISTDKPTNNIYLYFCLSSDSTLSSTTNVYSGHPVTRTIPDGDTAEVVFRRASGDDMFSNYRYQIEEGSTVTSYEPYDGQSITIPLGQTVYGGTADIISGKMTVEYVKYRPVPATAPNGVDIGDGWTRVAFASAALRPDYGGYSPATGFYSHGSYRTDWVLKSSHAYVTESRIAYFWLPCAPDEVRDFLATQESAGKPVELVYKILDPFTIDLTPAQLNTLAGENNVWSDAGDVALTYHYYEETEGY